MDNEELTFADLYADLVVAQSARLPEGYFTLSKFCNDTGLTPWVAKKRLGTLTESGALDTRLACVDGNHQRIWWFNQ